MELINVAGKQLRINDNGSLEGALACLDIKRGKLSISVGVSVDLENESIASSTFIDHGKQPWGFEFLNQKDIYEILSYAVGWLAGESGCTIWMDDSFRVDAKKRRSYLPIVILQK